MRSNLIRMDGWNSPPNPHLHTPTKPVLTDEDWNVVRDYASQMAQMIQNSDDTILITANQVGVDLSFMVLSLPRSGVFGKGFITLVNPELQERARDFHSYPCGNVSYPNPPTWNRVFADWVKVFYSRTPSILGVIDTSSILFQRAPPHARLVGNALQMGIEILGGLDPRTGGKYDPDNW